MSIEQERADFEAWFTKFKAYISDPKDIFAQMARDIAWDTWQARAAIESDRKRRGEPDVTPNMLRAAQINSELGAWVCANWAGAYGCIEELYQAMFAAAPQPAEPVRKRKAFICPNCEGVYADQPVSQCDCVPDKNEFIEGIISYPSAEPVKAPSDAEILDELQSHGALATSNAVCAVRALLARYGQAVNPINTNEWKRAIEDELVLLNSTASGFPSAKEAVRALVDWHVNVERDPVFRGEPEKEASFHVPKGYVLISEKYLEKLMGSEQFEEFKQSLNISQWY